jgi:hypothetical protein
MSTPENNSEPVSPENKETSSLLDQIIQTSHESSEKVDTNTNSPDSNTPTIPQNNTISTETPLVKKTRDPMTA